MIKVRPSPVVAVLCAGFAMAQDKPAPTPVTKSPQAAIAAAMAKAKAHNKCVLVVFEQQDNKLCAELAKTMKAHRDLSTLLRYEFDVATVDATAAADEAKARDFTAAKEVPALLVLSADDKVLGKFTAKDFVEGDALNTASLIAKLKELKSAPLDAEKVLAEGLSTAKKTNFRVFLRFDAPW